MKELKLFTQRRSNKLRYTQHTGSMGGWNDLSK